MFSLVSLVLLNLLFRRLCRARFPNEVVGADTVGKLSKAQGVTTVRFLSHQLATPQSKLHDFNPASKAKTITNITMQYRQYFYVVHLEFKAHI